MADVKISDLTATTTLADTDLFEVEIAGNAPRKITKANLVAALGGGAWDFDPPSAAGFSLMSSDATNLVLTDDTDIGLKIDLNGLVAGPVSRFAYKTLTTPASAWDMVCKCSFYAPGTNYTNFGLVAYNSTSNRNNRVQWANDVGLGVFRYSSASAYSSTLLDPGGEGNAQPVEWFRIAFDGTNLKYYCSPNGKDWSLMVTEAPSTYLTATGGSVNRVGFVYGVQRTTGILPVCSCSYFSLTGAGV